MQGCTFTWHNRTDNDRSLWKCLDRMLVNDVWLSQWPNCYYLNLTPRTSGHSPLVTCGESSIQNGSMFRFDNYLATSPDFIPAVQNVWQHHIVGTTMYAVTRKLKALEPVFRAQRRNKGDLAPYQTGTMHAASNSQITMAKGWRSMYKGFLQTGCN
ncbi:UNVERIFIED_CONTAM: hypothetical protein Sradi_5902100 [Sesamum radiatum]|uniref:Uncharacterized protein n=1 Tax=Sesamum radiatum TaxID=300843 RepID=A0AAW2KSL7_SESRA